MRLSRSQHIIALVLAVFVFAVWWTFHRGRDRSEDFGRSRPLWFVEASGDVRRPGVYTFEKAPTPAEVITAAGGLVPDDARLPEQDGSGPLASGTMVRVRSDETGTTAISESLMEAAKRLALGIPLDLNTATEQELALLPFIGPAQVEGIAALRRRKGGLAAPEDLLAVKGIGPETLKKLRSFVTMGP